MGHAVAEADLSKLGRLPQALVLVGLAIAYFLAGTLGLLGLGAAVLPRRAAGAGND